MNALKRILLFLVCFVVIALVACLILGAIVAFKTTYDVADPARARAMAYAAGREVGARYSLFIWLGSMVISAGIAFRWVGALIAGALGGLICLAVARVVVPAASMPAASAVPPAAVAPKASAANTEQERAIRLYPELGISNSPLNVEFVRRYRRYQIENKHYFDDPEWPTTLARESKEAIVGR